MTKHVDIVFEDGLDLLVDEFLERTGMSLDELVHQSLEKYLSGANGAK
jgi:hypothetical protein